MKDESRTIFLSWEIREAGGRSRMDGNGIYGVRSFAAADLKDCFDSIREDAIALYVRETGGSTFGLQQLTVLCLTVLK